MTRRRSRAEDVAGESTVARVVSVGTQQCKASGQERTPLWRRARLRRTEFDQLPSASSWSRRLPCRLPYRVRAHAGLSSPQDRCLKIAAAVAPSRCALPLLRRHGRCASRRSPRVTHVSSAAPEPANAAARDPGREVAHDRQADQRAGERPGRERALCCRHVRLRLRAREGRC